MIENYLFLLSFSLVYFLSLYFLYYYSNRKSFSLTSTSFFALIYTIYIFFPLIFNHVFLNNKLNKISWVILNDKLFLSSILGFVSFVSGTLVFTSLYNKKYDNFIISYRKKILINNLNKYYWLFLSTLGLLSTIIILIFFIQKQEIYKAILLSEQIGAQRQEIRSGAGFFTIQMVYIIPWLCLLTYITKSLKKNIIYKIAFYILFLISALAQAALLYRGNLIFFILLLIVSKNAINLKANIKSLYWIAILLVFFSLLTILRIGFNFGSDRLYDEFVVRIFNRLVSPLEALGYIIDTFPRNGFYPGKTFILEIIALLPGPDITFNGLIYKEMGYFGHGTVTPTILGEAFANLGFLGIFFELFFIGVLLQFIHFRLLKKNKNITGIFFYTLLTVYIGKSVTSGLQCLKTPFLVFSALFIICFITVSILKKSANPL
jgi:oligosaccharide repeat unit polymerase